MPKFHTIRIVIFKLSADPLKLFTDKSVKQLIKTGVALDNQDNCCASLLAGYINVNHTTAPLVSSF